MAEHEKVGEELVCESKPLLRPLVNEWLPRILKVQKKHQL
jgi:hypothetical protein